MLKIKDNVDLKELEKYGFKYDESIKWYKKDYFEDTSRIYYYIDIEDRIINVDVNEYFTSSINVLLYDLIKDELVEKVEK